MSTKNLVRSSLYHSILDGLFTAMMVGVADSYLIPYAIALGSTPAQVGLVASVPLLVGAIFQTFSAAITEKIGSRLKLINFFVFFHALSWLPILLIPYLVPKHLMQSQAPWILLICLIFFQFVGTFSVPAWQSLMTDYIPVKKRGKYFGWRNRLQGVLTVGVSVLCGLVLHEYTDMGYYGFTIIFCFAMMCRFYAWVCLTRMKEPFRHASHDEYFSFWEFLTGLARGNFGKFVLFSSFMSFSVFVSAPLLAVFILKDLQYSYVFYMLIVSVAALAGFIFQGLWGRFADLDGNIKILKIAGWGIALCPLMWMVSRNIVYLCFVQLIAGAFWGGFSLLVSNFLMEAVSPQKRIRCISYFNVMNTFSMVLGSVFGGWAIHHLPAVFGYSYLALFLLSCIFRVLVMKFFHPLIKDVRSVV